MLEPLALRTAPAPFMRRRLHARAGPISPPRDGRPAAASVELLVLPELRARELAAELDAVLGVGVDGGVVHELLALALAGLVLAGADARGPASAELPALVDEALVRL